LSFSYLRGHGIPKAIEAILIQGSRVEPRLAFLKPLSSAISIVCREGQWHWAVRIVVAAKISHLPSSITKKQSLLALAQLPERQVRESVAQSAG